MSVSDRRVSYAPLRLVQFLRVRDGSQQDRHVNRRKFLKSVFLGAVNNERAV